MSYTNYNYGQPGAFAGPSKPEPKKERRGSGLGAAGLLLAVIALLFAWIPFLGLVMIVPALIAVVLGVVGFAAGTITGKSKRGMPVLATVLGTSALVVAPAATLVGTMAAAPWGIRVAGDSAEVELEHSLLQNGVSEDRAEYISAEVGAALRHFAAPANWREGIRAMHRLGLAMDDFDRATRSGSEVQKADALRQLEENLARIADRHDVDLTTQDIRDVISAMEAQEKARRERHSVYYDNGTRVEIRSSRYGETGGCSWSKTQAYNYDE